MLKAIVFIIAGAIGFVVAFSIVNRDEIAAEVDARLENDFAKQCAARAQFPPELEPRAQEICGCMKYEFDQRGIKLSDAFGSKREEMQRISQDCMMVYR